MQVPFCKLCTAKFAPENPPHILPRCGHSFCAKCLAKKLPSSSTRPLICPEDRQVYDQISSLDQLPLNSAIIAMLETAEEKICPEHGKVFEYYCMTDKVG